MQADIGQLHTVDYPLPVGTPSVESSAIVGQNIGRLTDCLSCSFTDYLWNLKENNLWPIYRAHKENTVASLLEKLSSLEVTVPSQAAYARKTCKSCSKEFPITLREYFRAARAVFSGLCLDCVKHRNKGLNRPYACRSKHEEYQSFCRSAA